MEHDTDALRKAILKYREGQAKAVCDDLRKRGMRYVNLRPHAPQPPRRPLLHSLKVAIPNCVYESSDDWRLKLYA